MTRAVHTLSVVGAIVILGGIGLAVADSADGSGRPVLGALAPLDTSRVEGWTELARLTPEELAGGRIRAIDVVGDSLFVLQTHSWSLLVSGRIRGTYGSASTGAPEYLARADGIVRTPSAVAVLDAPRHRVTRWSTTGARLEDHVIGQALRENALQQALTASPAGVLLTSWISTDSGGHWLVQHIRDDGIDSLPRLKGSNTGESFNAPRVLPLGDSGFVVVDADGWRIRRYTRALRLLSEGQRQDAPHFRAPAAMARRMRERTAMMPEAMRRDFLLAETLPSLLAATLLADGTILALTVHDEESTFAEIVGTDGRPIASLWARPDSNTMFAVRGSLLRVRELDAVTIIERLTLRTND